MKHPRILKIRAMQAALFAGVVMSGAAGMSHAQSGLSDRANSWVQDIFANTDQRNQSLEKDGLGWELPPGTKKEKGNRTEKGESDKASVEPQQADQANAAEGWEAPAQGSESGSGSCKYASPEQEDFLCKMVRILYGPDTPRGPNRDMDENISAGGAGG
ncbi:MAG: hypothetical protein J0H48_06340 [Nitrosospira multiformis]|nr:hypothetical protein [Nitrosospira multiformis]